MGFGIWIYVIFHLIGIIITSNATDFVSRLGFPIHAKTRLIRTKRDKVGEVTLGQTKTPSFKMGLSVSLAESERFELSQDCYTLTD